MSSKSPLVTNLGHGLSQIRLPLPFERLRFVNAFVVEDGENLTLIDCGVDSDDGWLALVSGLSSLGRDVSEITTVIGTHLHIDHMGMAARLVAETGASFVMHELAETGLAEYNDWSIIVKRQVDVAARNGAPDVDVRKMSEVEPRPQWASHGIAPSRSVVDGDRIQVGDGRSLDVLHTPGHEPAHICLIDSLTGVLFSGDHVLPRITPVVLHDTERDQLATYKASLQRIEELGIGLTYPAHGTTIERGSLRARQIILHHETRLRAILQELYHGPKTAWEVLNAIFRPNLVVFETRLAFSETMAHLAHLVSNGDATTFQDDETTFYRIPQTRRSSVG